MKLFEVVFQRDGLTVKAPGVSETEIKTESLYYAAECAGDVWDAIALMVDDDPEREFFAIKRVLSAVTVLPGSATGSES